VVADPDLISTVEGADIIIFCAPHQVRARVLAGWFDPLV
jgi:glycerol-3-phosphate dehydrogenase